MTHGQLLEDLHCNFETFQNLTRSLPNVTYLWHPSSFSGTSVTYIECVKENCFFNF